MHRGSNGNEEKGHAAKKGEPPIRRKEQREARELLEEINGYLKENKITKVELIQAGYDALRYRAETDKKKD